MIILLKEQDHWLRSDHCFAYPKKEMTTEIESDWGDPKPQTEWIT